MPLFTMVQVYLNNAGISLSNSLLSQVIFGAANMLFTLIAIWKVDSAGRRPLYLAGTAGAAISLLATGICFATGATTSIWLLVLCTGLSCLFCFFNRTVEICSSG